MDWSLVYLHGVGQGVHDDRWYETLTESLKLHNIEMPSLQSGRVIVPTYVDLLKFPPQGKGAEPKRTQDDDDPIAVRRARRAEYARCQAKYVAGLPGTLDKVGFYGVAGVGRGIDPTTHTMPGDLGDAKRYLKSEALRHAILLRVLEKIGKQRELVVVGHSLGSIVGIDLLAHLPRNVRVRRFVTIGSPAGALGFHRSSPERLLRSKDFPFKQVEGWVNLFSPRDVVTRGQGVSPLFPGAVDVRLDMPALQHGATEYLSHSAVMKVLAEAISPIVVESAPTGADVEVALSRDESLAIDQVLFAAKVRDRMDIKSERRERFDLALSQVAVDTGSELADQRTATGRPAAGAIRALMRGEFHGLQLAERPLEEQLFLAVVAATNNPIAPFEVKSAKESDGAVEDLWLAYGYPKSDADKVSGAIREAREVFDSGDSWKWLALGATGIALIAVPPLGIAMGGASLAGGAALTAGLAAFGPGGMIGGMALAGSLIGIGGSAVTASLTRPGAMSADALQTQAVRLMAFSKASESLGIPGGSSMPWLSLNSWHEDLNRELERQLLFSDDNSPAVKDLRKKVAIVRKAVGWMIDKRLAPSLGS